jgi:hypothetical protein
VEEVHAIMNNNYSNWATKNAKRLEELLAQPPPLVGGGGAEGAGGGPNGR